MKLAQIKQSVDLGLTVNWSNVGYEVKKDDNGKYVIYCHNGSCIGLTYLDGVTLNGKEEDFYINQKASEDTADSWGLFKFVDQCAFDGILPGDLRNSELRGLLFFITAWNSAAAGECIEVTEAVISAVTKMTYHLALND